jgi:NAD(P)-dependent dehydrogenase (short-subunit alcohol dehydrogenase family)
MNTNTENDRDMPRVAVITGASSGIGLETAKALASQGWRIIGTGRDQARMKNAESQIRATAAPGVSVDMLRVDLALVADTMRAADEIVTLTDRVDVLINNAGGSARERVLTAEGNEATFAGNHLGHFVLTERLLPLLRAAAAHSSRGAVRIISTSSLAHEYAPGLNWDDLQMLNGFVPMPAYCNAKLANVLFTRALAGRLASDGIVAHAMHPGAVDTNFINRADENTQKHMRERPLLTAADAADTLIWLATATEPGTSTGGYFHQRKSTPVSAAANDDAAMQKLWTESEKLVARARG